MRSILWIGPVVALLVTSTALAGREQRPTYVLVHGAFHGGWAWQQVADHLRESGAVVYTPTLAGLGVLLVTVWQSLAQIEATYGRQSGTILSNHLSKVFYAGLSDTASLRYVQEVLGDAEIESSSRSGVDRLGGAGSEQWSTTRVPLAPAHALRQMRPGDALLVHGTLPPAHVRTRPFYRSRTLAERAARPFTLERPVVPGPEYDAPVAATGDDGRFG